MSKHEIGPREAALRSMRENTAKLAAVNPSRAIKHTLARLDTEIVKAASRKRPGRKPKKGKRK